MKNFFIITAIIIIATNLHAQIPNSGFENWTSMGSYSNPDSWGTMNDATAASGIFTATKGTPGNPGSAYLKLTSKTINSVVVNGIAVSGKLDSVSMEPISGFACNLRPQSLTGSWQHMIFGTSQGSVYAVLTKWNTGTSSRNTVAIADQTLSGMAMSWENFSINFIYQSGDYPDTCIIILKASGSNPSASDYLWVDNLAFSGSVQSIDGNNFENTFFEVFPNPSTELINVRINKNFTTPATLSIYNPLGGLILSEKINSAEQQINISALKKGIYFAEIVSDGISEKRKIVIY